jgi:hypothetical protein
MLHEPTITAVRLHQDDLMRAAEHDRCCGRGALVRRRPTELLRRVLQRRR